MIQLILDELLRMAIFIAVYAPIYLLNRLGAEYFPFSLYAVVGFITCALLCGRAADAIIDKFHK